MVWSVEDVPAISPVFCPRECSTEVPRATRPVPLVVNQRANGTRKRQFGGRIRVLQPGYRRKGLRRARGSAKEGADIL